MLVITIYKMSNASRWYLCKISSRSPRFAKGAITNLSDALRRRLCLQQPAPACGLTDDCVTVSGESRIIFWPERSSICQYRPDISAITVKTQSRARLVLAHPVLYIVKTQKNVLYNHLKINQKALWATFGNLHNFWKWVRQCNLC